MRIALVAHTNAPWTPHYARFFAGRGDTVLVVTFSPKVIEGIDTVFVGVEPWDMQKNRRTFITRVPRIRRILRKFEPDVVFGPYLASDGLSAVLAWKGPVIVSGRGGDVLDHVGRTGWRRRAREMLLRFVCRRADAIHTVAQEIEEELIRLGVSKGKLVQFPVGVDAERFHPAPDMPRASAVRLHCNRKHAPIYDNETIIAALADLESAGRSFRCDFLGEGDLTDAYKRQAATTGVSDRINFSGELPHAELPAMLRQADIYVSASLSDGTSSSLLEAMATGLLPVVTRIRANESWLEHGRTGLLFEPSRPDALADALTRAMDDFELRERAFAENRKRVVRDANMARNNERLAELCERVADVRGKTTGPR